MRKHSRFLLIALTVVLLSSIAVFGCAAPAPAPAPTPTPTTPPPAEVKPIELKFAIWLPPIHGFVKEGIEPWVAELEKKTNGRLKITPFVGGALGKAPDHYDLAVTGAADISYFMPSFTPGRFPLSTVLELPYMTRRAPVTAYAQMELFKQFPEMQNEFKDVHMYMFTATDPMETFTTKKPVRTASDIKGLNIRVPNPQAGEVIKSFGGGPTLMPMGDLYTAMQTGSIDGCIAAIEACQSFKVCEVSKYVTMTDDAVILGGMAFNLNTWNSLPDDIKAVLESDELGPFFLIDRGTSDFEKKTLVGAQMIKDKGIEMITLPQAEKQKWLDAAKPVKAAWVKDLEGKGLPAQKALDEAVRLENKFYDEMKNWTPSR